MIEIPLSPSPLVALIDDEDLLLVSGMKWHLLQQRKNRYAIANSKTADGRPTTIRMHKLLVPGAERVDHEDGNGLNNRRYNLRRATHQQNMCNSAGHSNRKYTYKGVAPCNGDKGKTVTWRAKITVSGRYLHVGSFANQEDAARAYDRAALKHFGEFAKTNFPISEYYER